MPATQQPRRRTRERACRPHGKCRNIGATAAAQCPPRGDVSAGKPGNVPAARGNRPGIAGQDHGLATARDRSAGKAGNGLKPTCATHRPPGKQSRSGNRAKLAERLRRIHRHGWASPLVNREGARCHQAEQAGKRGDMGLAAEHGLHLAAYDGWSGFSCRFDYCMW